MARKSKGFQIRTKPADRAVNSRTIKLTTEQNNRIIMSGLLRERTFSKVARDSIDSYLDKLNSAHGDYGSIANLRDAATIIGNGIDAESVSSFLIAWIESASLPSIGINDQSRELYEKSFCALRNTTVQATSVNCFEYIKLLCIDFFSDYLAYMSLYLIYQQINASADIEAERKEFAYAMFDTISEAPMRNLKMHAIFSPDLRFVTYLCWRFDLFQQPPQIPDDVIRAESLFEELYGAAINSTSE